MSGMSSPPATSSAPPSTGRADDLFALVKFVMSEDSHAHLKNLQEAEASAKAALEDATFSKTRLEEAWSIYHTAMEKFDKDRAVFSEGSTLQREMHQNRQSALEARESEVSRREEKCAERERELNSADKSWLTKVNAREAELSLREKEVSEKALYLSDKESTLDRKKQALEVIMRS